MHNEATVLLMAALGICALLVLASIALMLGPAPAGW